MTTDYERDCTECLTKILHVNNKCKFHIIRLSFMAWCSSRLYDIITFNTQLLLTSKFPGLISRCNTLAEWRYFNPEIVEHSSI